MEYMTERPTLPMASGGGCACCATDSESTPATTTDAAVATTVGVTGMTCENCVKHVTEELEGIAGVEGVDIELVVGGTSTVTIASADVISEGDIAAAIAEAGYEVAPV